MFVIKCFSPATIHVFNVYVSKAHQNTLKGWRSVELFLWKNDVSHSQGGKQHFYTKQNEGYRIGHILRTNGLVKHVIKEQTLETNVTERRGRRRMLLLDELKQTRRQWKLTGSTRLPSVENSLWKRPWNCLKTEYVMLYGMKTLKNTVIKLWVLYKAWSFDQVSNPQRLKRVQRAGWCSGYALTLYSGIT
jgi:hypothetical protein